MTKNILITGGAGFIGSHTADELLRQGDNVIVIDNLSSGKKENLPQNVIFYNLSLSQEEKLRKVIKKHQPQIILHFAAVSNIKKLQAQSNEEAQEIISGISALVDKNINPKLKKIIFLSSAAVYAKKNKLPVAETGILLPESFYGTYKLVSEYYISVLALLNNIEFTIFRLANIYGPRQRKDGEGGVIATFFGNLLRGEPLVIYGNGTKTRDFVNVEDVVGAVICAINSECSGIYNLSTQKETSILELANKVKVIKNSKNKIMFETDRQGEIEKSSLLNEKIKKQGWRPKISLEAGLIKMASQKQ